MSFIFMYHSHQLLEILGFKFVNAVLAKLASIWDWTSLQDLNHPREN